MRYFIQFPYLHLKPLTRIYDQYLANFCQNHSYFSSTTMFSRHTLYLALVGLLVGGVRCETRVAVAHLVTETISGSILFTETDNGIHVTGAITGLPVGEYGFHVHELGDTSSCDATGAHFNPDDTNHGGPDHDERHVGDFGNVNFVAVGENVVATVDFVDSVVSLRGRNSILGRALVLHADTDDLGLGGHETSLTTGNAGARLACAVIGIRSPSDPWNSAVTATPSILLLVVAFVFYIKF